MNNEGCYRIIRDAGIRSGESTCAIILIRELSQDGLLRIIAGADSFEILFSCFHILESGG